MSYAGRTSVPIERSRAELERLLVRAGADQFGSGWEEGRAVVMFRMRERFVRIAIAMPPKGQEQRQRSKWRVLVLVVKAKLEAIQSGVVTFEQEFLAHIVMPDNQTVGEHLVSKIAAAYETGKLPPLLPGMGATQ